MIKTGVEIIREINDKRGGDSSVRRQYGVTALQIRGKRSNVIE